MGGRWVAQHAVTGGRDGGVADGGAGVRRWKGGPVYAPPIRGEVRLGTASLNRISSLLPMALGQWRTRAMVLAGTVHGPLE